MKAFDLSVVYKQEINELKKQFTVNFNQCRSLSEKQKSVQIYKSKRRRLRKFFMGKVTISDLKVGERGYISPSRVRQDSKGVERLDPRTQVKPVLIPGESTEKGVVVKTENGFKVTIPVANYYAVQNGATDDWPIIDLRMGH